MFILLLIFFSVFPHLSLTFYTRKQNALRVLAIVWASVCLSIRPSVTLVICIKTVQARIMKSSLWAAPRFLVYRDKISCHRVQGFPSNEGVKEGYPLKKTGHSMSVQQIAPARPSQNLMKIAECSAYVSNNVCKISG